MYFPVRLAAVHLVDSHYCVDPSKFISILLTSLSTMLQIALPHVNVLSKGTYTCTFEEENKIEALTCCVPSP